MQQLRIATLGLARENGPWTRDKSQTFASYVQPSVRATIVSREIGGRRETAS
jgi:O-succinylbenzoate synthase